MGSSVKMRLMELEPEWVTHRPPNGIGHADSLESADGILFICPACWQKNGGPIGTHSVICWKPQVPAGIEPGPSRWPMTGTGFEDLTLTPSIDLTVGGGCTWHGFIQNGEVT
jgi:Family of unknown function (DUF6527)